MSLNRTALRQKIRESLGLLKKPSPAAAPAHTLHDVPKLLVKHGGISVQHRGLGKGMTVHSGDLAGAHAAHAHLKNHGFTVGAVRSIGDKLHTFHVGHPSSPKQQEAVADADVTEAIDLVELKDSPQHHIVAGDFEGADTDTDNHHKRFAMLAQMHGAKLVTGTKSHAVAHFDDKGKARAFHDVAHELAATKGPLSGTYTIKRAVVRESGDTMDEKAPVGGHVAGLGVEVVPHKTHHTVLGRHVVNIHAARQRLTARGLRATKVKYADGKHQFRVFEATAEALEEAFRAAGGGMSRVYTSAADTLPKEKHVHVSYATAEAGIAASEDNHLESLARKHQAHSISTDHKGTTVFGFHAHVDATHFADAARKAAPHKAGKHSVMLSRFAVSESVDEAKAKTSTHGVEVSTLANKVGKTLAVTMHHAADPHGHDVAKAVAHGWAKSKGFDPKRGEHGAPEKLPDGRHKTVFSYNATNAVREDYDTGAKGAGRVTVTFDQNLDPSDSAIQTAWMQAINLAQASDGSAEGLHRADGTSRTWTGVLVFPTREAADTSVAAIKDMRPARKCVTNVVASGEIASAKNEDIGHVIDDSLTGGKSPKRRSLGSRLSAQRKTAQPKGHAARDQSRYHEAWRRRNKGKIAIYQSKYGKSGEPAKLAKLGEAD